MCFLCFVLYVCTVLSNECERVFFSYSHRSIIGYLIQANSPLVIHVCFPCLTLVTCFPALATAYMFSRACHWFNVFPRVALVTCFLALGTTSMFSRACHYFYVFPRLPLVSCFPGLTLVTCFPALAQDTFRLSRQNL